MSGKPIVFISYSHKDEPKRPREGEVQWRSLVRSHLNVLDYNGWIEVWDDFHIEGGADWQAKILRQLEACHVCVLLVSRHSLTSQFILKVEIKTMLERRQKEGAQIYPILVSPSTLIGADWLLAMNVRPRDKKALSGLSEHDRDEEIVDLVEEILSIATELADDDTLRDASNQQALQSAGSMFADSEGVRSIDLHEPPPQLFGRDREVASVVDAALAGKISVVAGGPGMGKSAIAVAALYDSKVVERFGRYRVLVQLDTASEPRALLARLLEAFGAPSNGDDESLLRHLGQYVAERPAVAILDNAEGVFDADRSEAQRLLRLLGQIKGLSVIVTLRGIPPRVPGALVVDNLPKLDSVAARAAFVAIAGEKLADDPDLPELLEALDGHALSIQLVAGHATGLPSLRGLRQRWEDERAAILRKPAEDESRLTSVRVSLAASLDSPRLKNSSLARRLLSILAYLPVGLGEDGVYPLLASGSGVTKTRVNEAIARIHRMRLVEYRLDGRLRMLTPLRESVRINVPIEKEDRARLVARYLELAGKADSIGKASWESVRAEVEAEADNLDPVCRLALESNASHKLLGPALSGLAGFHILTGKGSVRSLELAVEQPDDVPYVAACLADLGELARTRSDKAAARSYFKKALKLFRGTGDLGGEARCLVGLGDIEPLSSDKQAANERNFKKALRLYRSVADVHGEATCLDRLGYLARMRTDNKAARNYYADALELYRQVGDDMGTAKCLSRLGAIAWWYSDFETASSHFNEALRLYRRIGAVHGEAVCLEGLGDVAVARSDNERAAGHYDKALALYRRTGDKLGEGSTMVGQGDIEHMRFNLDAASVLFERALRIYRYSGAILRQGNCHIRLGDVAYGKADYGSALEHFEEAIRLYRRGGGAEGEAKCLQNFGNVAVKQADRARALEMYDKALALYRRIDDKYGEGETRILKGRALRDKRAGLVDIRAGFETFFSVANTADLSLPGWRALFNVLTADDSEDRTTQLDAARKSWTDIGRFDLVHFWIEDPIESRI